MSHTPIDRLAQPSITPAAELVEALTTAARWVEKRSEERFNEHGTREWDTNATYYSGRAGEIYEALDEEDEAIAIHLRELAAALSTAPTTEPQPASPSGLVKEARIGLVMALANWSKYRNEAANEFVYQANKVATSAEELVAALAAPATADDVRPSNGALVEAFLEWLHACWPHETGSDFNKGVIRGFEIIKAQIENGHTPLGSAISTEQDRSTSKGEGA